MNQSTDRKSDSPNEPSVGWDTTMNTKESSTVIAVASCNNHFDMDSENRASKATDNIQLARLSSTVSGAAAATAAAAAATMESTYHSAPSTDIDAEGAENDQNTERKHRFRIAATLLALAVCCCIFS